MYTYRCTILHVVDGDTIDIELDLGFEIRITERVRLIGVDTPEVFGNKAEPAGTVASNFTKNWVAAKQLLAGHFVYESKKYDARDKYGRSLGTIRWTDSAGKINEAINDILLASGTAKKL